ncbi:MAG TPA: parallel beta-helix domain-containing protein [Kofleriaceae bacterium]|nr:parallel beta-helix domain-containing protein [Kofleriaceae bacterium]
MRPWLRLVLLSALAAPLAACGDNEGAPNACANVSGACTSIPATATGADIQAALVEAQVGDTIGFSAGIYDVDRDLSLAVDGVTLRGTGSDRSGGTVLNFASSAGLRGIRITSDHTTVEALAVEDSPGDGIRWEGTDGVHVDDVRVEWTRGLDARNGRYGLDVVQCENVLVEGCEVRGAADAGFHLGQSDNVVVRRNLAHENVAGIEIESSTRADVYANESTANTGGVLVFNLPGQQVRNGHGTRVFMNSVHGNDAANVAPAGDVVAGVPAGTGVATMAGHEVEIFDNTIADHDSVNLAVVSYLVTGDPIDDPLFDPYSDTIDVHDNRVSGTSDNPTGPLGALLAQSMAEIMSPPIVVPDLVWDGTADPAKVDGTGELMADFMICFKDNGDADFVNLHVPAGQDPRPDRDATPHACAHAALPAVVLP